MSDENNAEITAEQAFNQAAIGYSFQGTTLLPWSGSREIAAQAMGMKAPFLSEEDHACMDAKRPYPGAVRDVIIAMWICSIPNDDEPEANGKPWTVQRASNLPALAYREAEKWAIEKGLQKTIGEAFNEGLKTMMAILTGKAVSEFEVKAEGETGGKSEGKV